MKTSLLFAILLLTTLPAVAQTECEGSGIPCGNTVSGVITAGVCPTGCQEWSQSHGFSAFGNSTRITLTATSGDFIPTIEVEGPDGTILARKDGRAGSSTQLAVVLPPERYTARVIAEPAGSSGSYTLRMSCLLADPEVFCTPDAATLCLYDRFSVRVTLTGNGNSVEGAATRGGDRFGLFTAPGLTSDVDNPEILVKILDGRAINGSWWIFLGSLTGFDYEVTVRDTFYKRQKTYTKEDVASSGGVDLHSFVD